MESNKPYDEDGVCEDALIAAVIKQIRHTDAVVKAPRLCFCGTMRAHGRYVATGTGGVRKT